MTVQNTLLKRNTEYGRNCRHDLQFKKSYKNRGKNIKTVNRRNQVSKALKMKNEYMKKERKGRARISQTRKKQEERTNGFNRRHGFRW